LCILHVPHMQFPETRNLP